MLRWTRACELSTGLLLGLPNVGLAVRRSELFPKRRLDRCAADLIVPHYRLFRLGVLARCGNRPGLVWGVNTRSAMLACLMHPKVIGFITADLDTAWSAVQQLSSDQ